ncbi:MAG: OmpA family protein [Pseudomonadota bacterium]
MEGFLSLPRSAKGGLAVLLAVALLGWGIVAYSAKRQHDDTRSLQNALATLDGQSDREAEATAELESLQQRLTAAEGELATSRDAVATSQQAKSDIEAALAEREAELAAVQEQLEAASTEGGALTLLDAEQGGDQSASAGSETLRARLTESMTSLSAAKAMLQQKERELSKAQAAAEAAAAEIETLQAAAEQRDTLRARLTDTMTTLSARSATLQQKERGLSQAQAAAAAAAEEIEALKSAAAERDTLRARLTQNMTTLSAQKATVQQKERELAALQAELGEATASIDTMQSASADQEAAGRSLDALTVKLERTREALSEGAESLKKNQESLAAQQARLEELEQQQASIETAIGEKEAEIGEHDQVLAARKADIEAIEAEIADLSATRDDGMAESGSLTAELDGLEETLTEKQDVLATVESELASLEGDVAAAEARLAEVNDELAEKQSMVNVQDVEIQGAEASLAALKADRAVAEAEAIELKTAINRQQAALDDLAALKGEIDQTKEELAVQTALLSDKHQEIDAADSRLQEIRKASTRGSAPTQTLPKIAIADLTGDSLAVLPIDPMQTPMPVQTDRGIRLTLVHFDLGSAELTPGAMRRAKEAAAWIKQQGIDQKIRLVGSTDTIGTKEDNLVLARERAQSLLKVFADEGIDPAQIELISQGEAGGTETIADQTAEPLNRCVGVFLGDG